METIICGRLTNNELGDRIFYGTTLDDGTEIERFVLAEFFANSKKYVILCDSLFPIASSKLSAFVCSEGRIPDFYLTPVTEYEDLKAASGVIKALNCNNNYNKSEEGPCQDVNSSLFFVDEETLSNKTRLNNYILNTMRKHPAFTVLEKDLICSVMVEIVADDRMMYSELKDYWKGVYDRLQRLSDEECLCILEIFDEKVSAIADYIASNSIAKRVKEYVGEEVQYIIHFSNSEILLKHSNAKHFFNVKKMLIDLQYSTFIAHRDDKEKYKAFLNEWPPARIARFLSGSESKKDKNGIFGQEDACRMAAFVLYNHLLRISDDKLKEVEKENYLFLGPTGCGKTQLFKRLSKISPVPILFVDGASLVEEGYQGVSKDSVLTTLVGHYTKGRLERSILVVDEADKLFTPSYDGKGRDVHKQIQHSLLKLLENSRVILQTKTILDTSNITVVMLGAFEGLEGLIERRTHSKCGFLSSQEESMKCRYEELREGLVKYGATPEIMGRISCIVNMTKLSKDALKQIALDIIISDLEMMYATDEANIVFHKESILAELDNITILGGARGIKGILFPIIAKKMVHLIGAKNNPATVEITGKDIHEELFGS